MLNATEPTNVYFEICPLTELGELGHMPHDENVHRGPTWATDPNPPGGAQCLTMGNFGIDDGGARGCIQLMRPRDNPMRQR